MVTKGVEFAATVAAKPSLIGRVVADKFVIESVLGDGAMGVVYRARSKASGTNIALKILNEDAATDPTYRARFAREAKAASRLDHPNSVRVLDSGEDTDGLLYIAMEYVEGRDLHRVMHEDWPISDVDVADILAQALSAIGHAHEMGVVHRDLKPENLMILPGTGQGNEGRYRVKVCDFGIAKIIGAVPGSDEPSLTEKVTAQGMILGTPEYMSPEQARGEQPEPRSDLYSLGIILYHLLTGRTPFEGTSPLAVVLQHVTKAPAQPRTINPEVHEGLEAVCIKAIAKELDDRYATASEMRDALCALFDLPSARSLPSPKRTGVGRLLIFGTLIAIGGGAVWLSSTPGWSGADLQRILTTSDPPESTGLLVTTDAAAEPLMFGDEASSSSIVDADTSSESETELVDAAAVRDADPVDASEEEAVDDDEEDAAVNVASAPKGTKSKPKNRHVTKKKRHRRR